MVLLLLALVRDDLLRDWQRSLPVDAPNYFMINIRPDEGAGVEQFFARPACRLRSWCRCCVRGSLPSTTKPVERITFQGDRANEFVEREANLSWAAELSPGNKIDAGQWWRATQSGAPQISVEIEYAERLGLKLGDTLTYDIAGEAVTGRITSLRSKCAGTRSSRTSSSCSRPACSRPQPAR